MGVLRRIDEAFPSFIDHFLASSGANAPTPPPSEQLWRLRRDWSSIRVHWRLYRPPPSHCRLSYTILFFINLARSTCSSIIRLVRLIPPCVWLPSERSLANTRAWDVKGYRGSSAASLWYNNTEVYTRRLKRNQWPTQYLVRVYEVSN